MKTVALDGVSLTLSHPDRTEVKWVGQEEVMERLLACWLMVTKEDLPLCPRLIGKPGVGKTTLAIAAARRMKQDVYTYQCTMDTRPEDLLVTPVLGESGHIHYHASPVVSAMIEGGICILDEGNRMSEKSWASLAPLLDHRRYVESVIAGIKISAHPNFRCCVTMNDDASTYELPDYIMSRIQPMVEITFPPRKEEMEILRYNIPFAKGDVLNKTVDFLQRAHELDLDSSTRDGIHILRYTLKRLQGNKKLAQNMAWEEAVHDVLGFLPKDLETLAQKKRKWKAQENSFSNLSEFFFDPNPDSFPPDDPEIDDEKHE